MTEKTVDLIETKRLILRKFIPDDLHHLHRIISSPEVCLYLFTEQPFSLRQTEEWLLSMIQNYQETDIEHMAIVERESGKLIGFGGLSLEEVDGDSFYEVGCVLEQESWGKGYAFESLSEVLHIAKNAYSLKEVIGIIKVGHVASVALCEKLGFTYWKISKYEGKDSKIYRKYM